MGCFWGSVLHLGRVGLFGMIRFFRDVLVVCFLVFGVDASYIILGIRR
jgi:hypothetical protein